MKKTLLIIILMMAIFQIVVLATAIDIGNAAVDTANSSSGGYVRCDHTNAANGTGKITTIELWANVQMSEAQVATYYFVDATHITTRDDETLNNGNGAGVVLAGSKQTFTVDLDVVVGDYIAIYFTDGNLRYTASGSYYYIVGDTIPCTNQLLGSEGTRAYSIHGIGATASDNAIMFGINF